MSTKIKTANVKLKRVYEAAASDDGIRILVDRLWPRGVTKVEAALDRWEKDIAPSAQLRKWFGHDPAHWQEFQLRYAEEVHRHADQLEQLRALARQAPITLIYAAQDEIHNHAIVLRDCILGRTIKPASAVEATK